MVAPPRTTSSGVDSVPPAAVVAMVTSPNHPEPTFTCLPQAPAVPFHRLVHDRSIARPYLSSHTPLTSTADLFTGRVNNRDSFSSVIGIYDAKPRDKAMDERVIVWGNASAPKEVEGIVKDENEDLDGGVATGSSRSTCRKCLEVERIREGR
ncbi:unnamed protein product [Musa hybrid cultivar]